MRRSHQIAAAATQEGGVSLPRRQDGRSSPIPPVNSTARRRNWNGEVKVSWITVRSADSRLEKFPGAPMCEEGHR